ncbi:MAG: polyisoprenoid-binding protein [Bacteroidia bacterium]|nr:polyisoprenoid-binding protein [Bacteroidia bacterium]
MKKTIFTTLALILIAGFTFAQNWKLDNSHSSVNFEITHMVISTTTGQFKEFAIDFKQGKPDFSGSSVVATLQTASINTDNEQRDGHLTSPDFFDAEKYPTITFKSTSFDRVSEGKFTIKGELTMHGVTKEVTFAAKLNGTGKDPWGNTRSGWKVTSTISRGDFGLEWNKTLETGGVLVGDEVEITVNAEFIQGK